jgi:hypothetical protein
MAKIKKIYIDLDGVLADFDKWKLELAKTYPIILTDKHEFWKRASRVNKLYLNLEPMPDANNLMFYLSNLGIPLAILTALPMKRSIPSAEKDKRTWVKLYIGDIEFNVGPYARDKQNFSGEGLLLIDDKEQNIIDWENKGGIGILYTDFNLFKLEIEKYLE